MKGRLLSVIAFAGLLLLPIGQLAAQSSLAKGQRVRAVADYEKVATGDLGWFYAEVSDGEPSMLVVWDKDIDATPNIDYLEEDFPRILSGRVYFVNKDAIVAVSGEKKANFQKLAADWLATGSPETLFPVGSRVIIGKHNPSDGSDADSANWSDAMDEYVGKEATVTGHSGSDSYDKNGVELDIDADSEHGHYFWRIENLTLIERGSGESATGDDEGVYSEEGDGGSSSDDEGAYSDDGSGDESSYSEDSSSEQEYDAEDTAFFEAFPVGTKVIIGRHTKVDAEADGSDNWTEEMDAFVGQEATITSHEGLCPWGEASAKVDIDDGQYYWRIRDMKKVE